VNIVLSAHAKRRMLQRRVREVDIQIALEHPDDVCETPEPSNLYLRTMFDGRTLKVWTVLPEVGDDKTVKSVAWKGEDDIE